MIARRAAIVPALFVVLAAAACSSGGGGSDSSSSRYGGSNSTTTTAAVTTTTAAPAAGAGAAAGATVKVGDTRLGKVVVDSQGRTLYLFGNDQGTVSACGASCRGTWPPVVDGGSKATTGTGLDASKLTTVVQSDGTRQVAYNGHLLYTYAGDRAVGDTNGQGVGGIWFAVTTAGERAA